MNLYDSRIEQAQRPQYFVPDLSVLDLPPDASPLKETPHAPLTYDKVHEAILARWANLNNNGAGPFPQAVAFAGALADQLRNYTTRNTDLKTNGINPKDTPETEAEILHDIATARETMVKLKLVLTAIDLFSTDLQAAIVAVNSVATQAIVIHANNKATVLDAQKRLGELKLLQINLQPSLTRFTNRMRVGELTKYYDQMVSTGEAFLGKKISSGRDDKDDGKRIDLASSIQEDQQIVNEGNGIWGVISNLWTGNTQPTPVAVLPKLQNTSSKSAANGATSNSQAQQPAGDKDELPALESIPEDQTADNGNGANGGSQTQTTSAPSSTSHHQGPRKWPTVQAATGKGTPNGDGKKR